MKYIYLDQKIWIELARIIVHGTNDTRKQSVVEKIRMKVEDAEWALPLSLIHQFETSKRLDDRTRKELSSVMGDFSKNYAMAPYLTYKSDEFLVLILSMQGLINEKTPLRDKIIRRDFANIAGQSFEGLEITSEHFSESEKEKLKIEFLQYVKDSNLFSFFADYFSSNEFADDVKSDLNYFAKAYEDARKELHASVPEKHKEFRYRIFLINCFMETFKEDLLKLHDMTTRKGLDIKKLIPDSTFATYESTMNYLCGAPSFHVRTTLTYEILNSRDRKLSGNDYYDISFLSTAIPYCDVVVTEKSWTSVAKKYKLDTIYNTKIYSKLDDLLD